jgi:hypothetical protein
MKIDNKAANIGLIIIILYGIVFSCYQTFTMPVISDTVNPGLYAREFWSGNQQYFVPVNDPYVIDYALNLLVAPLSGYQTWGLFLTSYMIYLGIVLFSGLLARKISGDMAGLAAMALIANAPDPALKYLIYPVWHGSTILIILIALYAYFGLKSHIKIIALGLLAIIGVLNDTLIVPFLIAPLLVLSVYNYFKSNNKPEREESLGIIIAMVLGLMVLIVKGVGFSLWPNGLYITDVGSISGQMSASLKIDMLWQYLQSIINMSGGIVLASVLIIGIYSAWKYKANRRPNS